MTAPDPGLPRIDALDLRPDTTDETVEVEWDWPTPPAVSIEEKQSRPAPPGRETARTGSN